MKDCQDYIKEVTALDGLLKKAKRVLVTAPGTADGDSLGSQLALRRIISHRHPNIEVCIINDEELPSRYRFLPDVDRVRTPDNYMGNAQFDVGILVDGGIDRAGRVRTLFERCKATVFIDHHVVSVEFPYTIRIVEPKACSTTEVIYYISQTDYFKTPLDNEFCQQIYLGLIFDTGFFRHSNTTPEGMELAAKLIRSGFDFTRVGEHGMLERTYPGLQLLAFVLSRAQLRAGGKIIWASLTRETLSTFNAEGDDREGIIDHLFLTKGIEVAVLFNELSEKQTRISLRSQGTVNVAKFARSVTKCGGGHEKAAGALLDQPLRQAIENVLSALELVISKPH